MIAKTRDSSVNWIIYHGSLGTQDFLRFTNASKDNNSTVWNTAPTSSVFGVGSANGVNELNDDYIAFLWHDVPGLQKFGTYEGSNSSSNGPFVDLGFRPAIVWVKNIDSSASWVIYDDQRGPINPNSKVLNPDGTGGGNANDAFVGSYPIDILSNGFRIRNNTGEINNGDTFIYCAWAKAPSIDLFGGGANAR